MDFNALVKALLEAFKPPYDQGRFKKSRTYSSKGNDISNPSKTTSVTSAYDHKLGPATPTTIPGNLFPTKEDLRRRARRRKR